MTFSELTLALGIEKYPEALEEFYKRSSSVSICDTAALDSLEKEYSLLGRYLEPLKLCAAEVEKIEPLRCYGDLVAAYIRDNTRKHALAVPLPQIDGCAALDLYPLLILCALVPSGIREYERRGFSKEEIYKIFSTTFEPRIAISESQNMRLTIDRACFNWLLLYVKAEVFPCGIFNITPKFMPDNVVVLKNKKSGECAAVMTEGDFHRTGMALGSESYEDNEGSFSADFTENDDEYIGHPSINSRISSDVCVYRKSEWEEIVRCGDGVAGVHIPRGANLTPENIRESFRLALKMTQERYPEYRAKAVHCTSWLLDPTLGELLGEASKITGFQNSFLKFPHRGDGKAIFGFVFPRIFDSYESLPEDTSLQRKLKKLYIDGGRIIPFSGIVTDL